MPLSESRWRQIILLDAQKWIVGTMAGTSLDGIDVALIKTDGETIFTRGQTLTQSFAPSLRRDLQHLLGSDDRAAIAPVERELTLAHEQTIHALLTKAGLTPPDIALIGFHGQTLWHRPKARATLQIGDAALLSRALQIPVAHDFRQADVAAGGEGAPLAPLYHQALAVDLAKPLAVLNLGGVGNVTYLGDDANDILAFDTGPGNALLDDWIATHTGQPFDKDGAIAATGKVNLDLINMWLKHRFFAARPPKSLDRNEFATLGLAELSVPDGAATLLAFTISSVVAALQHLPKKPLRWLVTGGGRHNNTLIAGLGRALQTPVEPVETVGWNGDALEAEAFGYLAARVARKLPLSLPTTTGAPQPMPGGKITLP